MASFDAIPILDVSPLIAGDVAGTQALVQAFRDAYSTVGFGMITGHGVPHALVDRVFDASRRFHALPTESKMAVSLDANHRGFIPINTSTDVTTTLAEVERPNQSESFMIMREDGSDAPDVQAGAYLAGPNQWPDLPGFRDDVMAYHDALATLGKRLMRLAAQAIGVAPERVLPAFERPTTWLRLLYYPPTEPQTGVYGSAPHTDFGCLTILAQDDVGGLQVMTPARDWIDVPYMPGAFVVNVGDMLHRWSNGVLRSTPHRVINRSGRVRYSCPFFFDPNVATRIAPLPETVGPDRPAQYEPIHFGDFLRSELEAGYDQHKPGGQT